MDLATFFVIGGFVLAAAVWVFALGGAASLGLQGDDPGPVAIGPVTLGPTRSPAPLGYKETDCGFKKPDGVAVECGRLTVLQGRTESDGATVTLPVAVFSAGAGRQPDPVIYLDGGPGGNTLVNALGLYDALKPLAGNRDLVLFDQRGAGGSDPSLDCPELTELNYDLLERQYTNDQRVAQDAAAVKSCYERLLSEGVDPTFATSAENAADVDELRVALGYDEWNLYGVSYGTKLALTVMRDFPGGVRSVILDSTYPLQVDLYGEIPADFRRALDVLFGSCAGDSACSAAYPELKQAFADAVRHLNERPVSVTLGELTGRPVEGAVIDGTWFAEFMFQSLYSAELIPLLPKAIADTRDGNYEILTILADAYLQNAEAISPGMYLSVQCGEELAFTDRNAALKTAQADKVLADSNEYSVKSIFASCNAWHAPQAPAVENKAVNSAIPTLVLAGEFDPITPPAWGRLAADGLGNSFFFAFPGLAHGVALGGECPLGIATAFLADPQQQPASGCVAYMPGSAWAVY